MRASAPNDFSSVGIASRSVFRSALKRCRDLFVSPPCRWMASIGLRTLPIRWCSGNHSRQELLRTRWLTPPKVQRPFNGEVAERLLEFDTAAQTVGSS